MTSTSPLGRLTHLAEHATTAWLPWVQALALLAARLYLAQVFFQAGQVKLADWEATLFLFAEEYQVPLLPPELAAWAGTAGELGFSALLALGLFGRLGAVGLFMVNLMAVISYPGISELGHKDHLLWGVLAASLALFGPGKLSLDAWWWPRWVRSQA